MVTFFINLVRWCYLSRMVIFRSCVVGHYLNPTLEPNSWTISMSCGLLSTLGWVNTSPKSQTPWKIQKKGYVYHVILDTDRIGSCHTSLIYILVDRGIHHWNTESAIKYYKSDQVASHLLFIALVMLGKAKPLLLPQTKTGFDPWLVGTYGPALNRFSTG